ncbi:MAG: sigma-70 family RNA polymerase sigma factor [Thermoanaerobaculia bacterium]|nr:sigma-70 family RNA polymerase sigma factor [Thermoanaerobaculia bacterium]
MSLGADSNIRPGSGVSYCWAMSESPSGTVSAALEAVRRGEESGLATLYAAVYDDLREVAHRQRRRWIGNATLDTTSLVHESYLRLVGRNAFDWNDKRHFFAVAAKAMRHILIDYAEQQNALRRGGDHQRVTLADGDAATQAQPETLLALGAGLDELSATDARRATVFELRFFLGSSVLETAQLLDISPATVKRDWALAAAFLRLYLGD